MSKTIPFFVLGLFLIGGSVFASWFGYTDLFFFDGMTTGKTLDMNINVGTGLSGFWIDIYNPTNEPQSLKLDFVSQIQTADGRLGCDMISGKEFGKNLIWNMGNFVVEPLSTERRRVDFDFHICTSGTFDLCAVQLAPTEKNIGSFDIVEGKVNFFTLDISPSLSCTPFNIKIFPGSRPGENFINKGEIRFYDLSKDLVYSGSLESDAMGIGILKDTIPSGVYSVVYKGQSQLASYLSNVEIIEGSELFLDFTTGTNLINTQNKSISQDDGYQYQIAGDLKNIEGMYDFMINGNDIAILTISGFIDSGISILDPKNLNGDGAINVSDISIVGINFEQTDPYLKSMLFTW